MVAAMTKPRRPPIGITVGDDDRRSGFFVVREDYVRAVERAGGIPLALATADAGPLLDCVRGLVLSGGSDVDPALYGAAPHSKLGRVSRARDDFELALVRDALRRRLPVLGICRGHQLLNVALGGTLIQDIPAAVVGDVPHDSRRERWEVAHEVAFTPGTRLHSLFAGRTVAVNSFHHQAIDRLGDGLVVSARSRDDRVIEGIELPDRPFVLGVQWHPEAFWREEPGFAVLFEALVHAARHPRPSRARRRPRRQ
jgi:putative glutamine amidotransferase